MTSAQMTSPKVYVHFQKFFIGKTWSPHSKSISLSHAGRTLLQHPDFLSLQFIILYEFSDFLHHAAFKTPVIKKTTSTLSITVLSSLGFRANSVNAIRYSSLTSCLHA